MTKKLQLEDIKRLQLDILISFDDFCKQHNLRYVLAYGTLIGAVRHKGFIPWDDDIDLCMPNKDYLKMIDIVNGYNNGGMITERYRIADARVNSEIPYHQTFAKIYDTKTIAKQSSLKGSLGFQEGVFIDIFTISGVPLDENEAASCIDELRLASTMAYYASRQPKLSDFDPRHPRQSLINLVGYMKASRRSVGEWIRLYAESLDKLPDSDTSAIAYDVNSRFTDGDRYALSSNPWFPCVLADFDGCKFPIPEKYDEILTAFYGSYMEFPPVKDRQPSHDQGYYLI